VSFAVSMVNAATIDEDESSLLSALQLPYLRLGDVVDKNASTYLRHLTDARQRRTVITSDSSHIDTPAQP